MALRMWFCVRFVKKDLDLLVKAEREELKVVLRTPETPTPTSTVEVEADAGSHGAASETAAARARSSPSSDAKKGRSISDRPFRLGSS